MRRSGRMGAAAVLALAAASGCYDWVAIKPTEIPRFAAGPHEVRRPDGEVVRFDGPVTLKVHTPKGTLTYQDPKASISDGALAISGQGSPPAEIRLEAIDRAKVGQLQTGETAVTILVALAGAALVVLAITVPLIHFPGP